MKKVIWKKGLSFVLSCALVAGLGIGAFATDPVTSGDTTGTGTAEGHVDKKKMSVTLPTVVAGAFDYSMDPEKLIEDTDHAKYGEGDAFPASNDTYVYFKSDYHEPAIDSSKTLIGDGSNSFTADTVYYERTNATGSGGELDSTTGDYYTPVNKATTAVNPATKYYSVTYTKVASPQDADIATYYEADSSAVGGYKKTADATVGSTKTYYTKGAYTLASGIKVFEPDDTIVYFTKTCATYTETTATAPANGTTYYVLTKLAGDDYTNSSRAFTVTNKSTDKINLTVSVSIAEADKKETDIPLVAESAIASATDPSLYLGLVVGTKSETNKATAILADTAASKTVELAGTPGNFKTVVTEKTVEAQTVKVYDYRAMTLDEYRDAAAANASKTANQYEDTWASTTFNLEGAVAAKAITSTTTAPKLTVTWSWADPNAVAADPGFTWTESKTITYTTGNLTSITSIEFPNGGANYDGYNAYTDPSVWGDASVADNNGITTITFDSKFLAFYSGENTATITYVDTKGATATKTLAVDFG